MLSVGRIVACVCSVVPFTGCGIAFRPTERLAAAHSERVTLTLHKTLAVRGIERLVGAMAIANIAVDWADMKMYVHYHRRRGLELLRPASIDTYDLRSGLCTHSTRIPSAPDGSGRSLFSSWESFIDTRNKVALVQIGSWVACLDLITDNPVTITAEGTVRLPQWPQVDSERVILVRGKDSQNTDAIAYFDVRKRVLSAWMPVHSEEPASTRFDVRGGIGSHIIALSRTTDGQCTVHLFGPDAFGLLKGEEWQLPAGWRGLPDAIDWSRGEYLLAGSRDADHQEFALCDIPNLRLRGVFSVHAFDTVGGALAYVPGTEAVLVLSPDKHGHRIDAYDVGSFNKFGSYRLPRGESYLRLITDDGFLFGAFDATSVSLLGVK
jgi:hypothetical protein